MKSTVAAPLADRPRRMLAMRGESLRKDFADTDWKRELGALIARAIDLSGWTRKQVAFALGYTDETASAVSRWISGAEPPPLARFLSIAELRRGFLIALAESDGAAEVRTVVTVPHARKAVNE